MRAKTREKRKKEKREGAKKRQKEKSKKEKREESRKMTREKRKREKRQETRDRHNSIHKSTIQKESSVTAIIGLTCSSKPRYKKS